MIDDTIFTHLLKSINITGGFEVKAVWAVSRAITVI